MAPMYLKNTSEKLGLGTVVPDFVYRDLVAMLFRMRRPVLGLGVAYVAIGIVIAVTWQDAIVGVLTAAAALVTAERIATIAAYNRAAPLSIADLQKWERRYAAGCYMLALLIAALNVRALTYHYPLMHMITVSLAFSFGAGVVSRIPFRPKICVIALLLATLPTAAAFLVHAFIESKMPGHSGLFALEGLLVASIAALSLESVCLVNEDVVRSLTTRHDLSLLAKQDELTGLANRLSLRERFDESIVPVAQKERHLALHFLDLDGFKAINDVHGHPAGDVLLRVVAERLKRMVRAEDTVARLGGDEFVVVQAAISQASEAEMLARRIIKQISAPYDIDGQQMRISVSVGIALAPEQGLDFEKLSACADAALYRSKGGGKGQLHFCTAEDAASALAEVA